MVRSSISLSPPPPPHPPTHTHTHTHELQRLLLNPKNTHSLLDCLFLVSCNRAVYYTFRITTEVACAMIYVNDGQRKAKSLELVPARLAANRYDFDGPSRTSSISVPFRFRLIVRIIIIIITPAYDQKTA